MPEKKSDFIATATALLALAFAAGFFVALASIGRSGVLYKFALNWELTKALLYVASWAPAILLAASAIAMESSSASEGFSGAAYRVMAPAFALAAVVSIFYLLVVPGLEERKNRYESQSQLFTDSLAMADAAFREGRLADAERYLLACAAVDQLDERYTAMNDRVKAAEIKAQSVGSDQPSDVDGTVSEGIAWKAANRFYLEALEARKEGRAFDAHYLAKRSAAIYSKRPEVRRLVEDTWNELQRLGPSADALSGAAYYKRKLEGYSRFQEGDYLEAYRIYSELAADDASDADVRAYLERSAEGLSSIAFFIEQDEAAFSRSDERPFSLSIAGADGRAARLSAARAATSEDAVYFRDLALELGGDAPVKVSAPFARLHGQTLMLRAVDRLRPELVWEPVYEAGARVATGGGPADPGYAIKVPFDQGDAVTALRLSGEPGDIPLALLATGLDDARRLGIRDKPLLVELAGRAAYPFAVIMLALIGAGMGVRFKPADRVSPASKYLTAPLFVALAIPPLRVFAALEGLAARAFAEWVPSAFFLPAWLGFLGLCVAACLLAAARIAGRSLR